MKNRMEKYEDLDGQKINNNDAIKECRNKFYSKLCELRERASKKNLSPMCLGETKTYIMAQKSTNGLDRIVSCHGRGRNLCWGSHKGYRVG